LSCRASHRFPQDSCPTACGAHNNSVFLWKITPFGPRAAHGFYEGGQRPAVPPGCFARAHPSVRRCGETARIFDRPAYVLASLT